uniref:Uncharacterized protein n=1 Tax=Aegilops tauschii subsp. strangulata TaxID=200361 RepID=A0A453P9A7_AEGTS
IQNATSRSRAPAPQIPTALPRFVLNRPTPMAAPESKHETETPAPSREQPPEPVAEAAAGRELQPWEQHAAVINLPRYDYRASGSLLLRSHSGFLITCPISARPPSC